MAGGVQERSIRQRRHPIAVGAQLGVEGAEVVHDGLDQLGEEAILRACKGDTCYFSGGTAAAEAARLQLHVGQQTGLTLVQ